jgi:cell wall-associated NlpC family hydrolase
MKKFMSLWMPLILTGILLGSCTSQTEKSIAELEVLLDELKLEYAPDDRFEWWNPVIVTEDKLVLGGEVSSKDAFQAIVQGLEKQFPEVQSELLLIPEDGDLVNGLVNNSVIHLRREPSSKKEMVTQGLLGAPIRILKSEGSKSLIQVADGYLGWVNSAEVYALSPEELGAYKEADKVVFTAQYGMCYSEPDENSLPVTDLVIRNILVKLQEGPEFSQVLYPDGRSGWVKSSDLVQASEVFYKSTLKENLVQTALKFHGIPYLWGGTSSKNIDCSGLVCNVYYMNGMQLPRDADMQALIGKELSTEFVYEGLEPGDLLFFGRKATEDKEESVTHVALYIGGGEYIHSAGWRERVSINSMDSTQDHFIERYPEIFVRSVRILGEEAVGFHPLAENKFYQQIIAPKE